jgi:hypothetical protein
MKPDTPNKKPGHGSLHLQPDEELPAEVRAAAMHVELSRPESASEWFPTVPLILCTLVVGVCLSVSHWIVAGTAPPSSYVLGGLTSPALLVGDAAAIFGQFVLIPFGILLLHRNPSLRSLERIALLLGTEAICAWALVPLAG